jgi:NADPH:quinone reductase-like Zn-dependent oxidoreductase
MVSLGVIKAKGFTGRGLGYENCGIVTKVGKDVTSLKVGDCVIGSFSGSFPTRMVLDAKLCAKIPDSMTFAQRATMSTVYCTAMYCLEDTANLGKHNVCGLSHIFV